jgi:hypothetical protein
VLLSEGGVCGTRKGGGGCETRLSRFLSEGGSGGGCETLCLAFERGRGLLWVERAVVGVKVLRLAF